MFYMNIFFITYNVIIILSRVLVTSNMFGNRITNVLFYTLYGGKIEKAKTNEKLICRARSELWDLSATNVKSSAAPESSRILGIRP